MHLNLANQSQGTGTNLSSFFNLTTKDVEGNNEENITFALSQDELTKLFDQVQTVQTQVAMSFSLFSL